MGETVSQMYWPDTKNRILQLRREISLITAQNRAHSMQLYHSPLERSQHQERAIHLQQIKQELARMFSRIHH